MFSWQEGREPVPEHGVGPAQPVNPSQPTQRARVLVRVQPRLIHQFRFAQTFAQSVDKLRLQGTPCDSENLRTVPDRSTILSSERFTGGFFGNSNVNRDGRPDTANPRAKRSQFAPRQTKPIRLRAKRSRFAPVAPNEANSIPRHAKRSQFDLSLAPNEANFDTIRAKLLTRKIGKIVQRNPEIRDDRLCSKISD